MKTEDWDNSLIVRIVKLMFLSKFAVILLTLILFLILGISTSRHLTRSLNAIHRPEPEVDLLEKGLTNLYLADNNFRHYTISLDNKYLQDYRKNLDIVAQVFDTLREGDTDPEKLDVLSTSMRDKELLHQNYIHLKILLDSLMKISFTLENSNFVPFSIPSYGLSRYIKTRDRYSSDTITETKSKEKRSFFKKVKELFKEDSLTSASTKVVNFSSSHSDSISEPVAVIPEQMIVNDIHSFYRNTFELYKDSKQRLNQEESNLFEINSSIIRELEELFKSIRRQELKNSMNLRAYAANEAKKSSGNLILVAASTFLIAGILLIIILFYLQKIGRISNNLQLAKVSSDNLAKQKSSFLRNMSHEIRAPLNNIIGFSEQLTHEKLNPDQETLLRGIQVSSDILLLTVNQILDFSTLESGKMNFICRNFNPSNVIKEVIDANALRAKQKRLSVNLQPGLDPKAIVCGDDYRLKQVLTNLVDNAIKYSGKGLIEIEAKLVPTQNQSMTLNVSVSDQGIGIPEDQLNNIFIEFNRLDSNGLHPLQTGTGLGLPICKKIVEQQNGNISVSSILGSGSIFSFSIPYQLPGVETIEKPSAVAPDYSVLHGKRILLAEDDEFSHMLVSRILEKQQVNLTIVDRGADALRKLESSKFDMLLTDINMPGMDGFELCLQIRQSTNTSISGIIIIATTAHVMEPELKQIMAAGFNGYILKPFRESELLTNLTSRFLS